MKNGATILFRYAFALLAILALCGMARSAAPDSTGVKTTVRVAAVASREFSELESHLMRVCEQAVRSKGFKTSDKPDVELFVAVSEIPGADDLLALSFIVVTTPPEKLVAFAGENELFYRVSEKDWGKLPEEGRAVRRTMSEDYMRQYGMVQGHRIFIVKRSRLAEETAEAAGVLLSNRTFLR